ncbi:uncharacterized protein PGTG_04717 [Puccinia graminis f. sp. tritici CRL 75-36-700-3]|uniref:Uncharacterized protein n=1 Tax=Puccinia graminis f. sp. tritici (strain CRL 75-36-700-3 / race SCCL) TaxID=418459 RepID=E3K3V9_PUCGT|nr:uncharacterized protein PGTG_04717 [Puccinia graminis f. sp. tritici CRL 75-36-700-3]EFP78761.1 hypothetical protein PGTG_04717 [Puccinia graminis f. sp. tritici CRL 75-36-700-3]
MSTINSTQPSQTDASQPTQNTTQASETITPHPTNHETPARGRGSRGGRGGGARGRARGGRAVQRGGQTRSQPGTRSAPRSWTKDRNRDGLSSVDLIVEWLTVEGRYDLWRNSTVSKREVCELINQYLIDNGGESRLWRGIEQQVTTLEKKFRDALAWRDQTGQGILDEADELAQQAGGNSEDEDFVGNAITETEKKIRSICRYFYELEPVMLDRPSAVPLNTHEQGDDDDLTRALNLDRNEDRPTTPEHWSASERGGPASPVNTLGLPSPDVIQSLPATARSTAETPVGTGTPAVAPSPSNRVASRSALAAQRPDAQAQRRVSYSERITDRLFPSRDEMASQTTAEIQMNRDRLDTDNRMVDANISLINALSQGLAPTAISPEQISLQNRQLQLDLQLREVEVARARAALAAEEASGAAFAWARMVQDFIGSGLAPAEALEMTNQILGPVLLAPPQTPVDPSQTPVDPSPPYDE